jgi:hypothetical protein
MDMAHELMLRLLDGALHKAPLVESPGRVLDVGTGTGIWAIDMAVKHPGAEVTGIDLRCNLTNHSPMNQILIIVTARSSPTGIPIMPPRGSGIPTKWAGC